MKDKIILTSGNYRLKILSFRTILDLDDYDSAVRWVRENVADLPESFYDEDFDHTHRIGDAEYEFIKKMRVSEIYEKINEYQSNYSSIKERKFVEVYRGICVDYQNEINFDKLGTWWSFESSGVGCYGGGEGKQMFVLKGVVSPQYIDWESGLYSFVFYGEAQWEAYLKEGSPIKIIELNYKKLDKVIEGMV